MRTVLFVNKSDLSEIKETIRTSAIYSFKSGFKRLNAANAPITIQSLIA